MNLKEYEIINIDKASFEPAFITVNHRQIRDIEDDADLYLVHDADLDSLRTAKVGETINFLHTRLFEQNGTYYHDLGLVDWVYKDDGSYLIKCVSPTKLVYRIKTY